MNDVVITSTAADSTALHEIEVEYAEFSGALAARVATLITRARTYPEQGAEAHREDRAWMRRELGGRVDAVTGSLLPAARSHTGMRDYVEALESRINSITTLLDELDAAGDGVQLGAGVQALQSAFALHADDLTTRLIPALAADRRLSLAELWEETRSQMRARGITVRDDAETPSEAEQATAGGAGTVETGAHTCSCGHEEAEGHPELDVRSVPHAIRHATVFGALDSIGPGGGLVLVAPHDPLPLLAQIEDRFSGAFSVTYLERGPQDWRLEFTRG